jgi:hypothetical protein
MEPEQDTIDKLLLELMRKNEEAHQAILDQLRQANAAIISLTEAMDDLRERLARIQPPSAQRIERYSSDDVRIYRDSRGGLVSIHLGNRRLDPSQVVRTYEQGLPAPEGTLTIEMDEGSGAEPYQIVIQGPRAKDVAEALGQAGCTAS